MLYNSTSLCRRTIIYASIHLSDLALSHSLSLYTDFMDPSFVPNIITSLLKPNSSINMALKLNLEITILFGNGFIVCYIILFYVMFPYQFSWHMFILLYSLLWFKLLRISKCHLQVTFWNSPKTSANVLVNL